MTPLVMHANLLANKIIQFEQDTGKQNTGSVDSDGDAVNNIVTLFNTFYGYMLKVGLPLAAIAIGICAFKLFMADSEQESARVKKLLVIIIIGVCLLFLAPAIVKTISNLWDVNPDLNNIRSA